LFSHLLSAAGVTGTHPDAATLSLKPFPSVCLVDAATAAAASPSQKAKIDLTYLPVIFGRSTSHLLPHIVIPLVRDDSIQD